jgi:endonuclease YncB( thermonuclease family)
MTPRYMAILAGAILVAAAGALAIPDARGLEGTARVVDGDTLEINGVRVRLWGIDAFEHAQTCQQPGGSYSCGRAASQVMEELTRNQYVRCSQRDTDRYKRVVAQCFVGTTDLGQALVLKGWAFDYTHYSGGFYKDAQAGASEARRGAWRGSFQWPWDYRHGGAGK